MISFFVSTGFEQKSFPPGKDFHRSPDRDQEISEVLI